MPSTINASTTSGLIQTADSSGVLQLQTGNTTAITIDLAENVYVQTNLLWQFTPAPTSIAGATTLSAAQVATGLIVTTGTTYTATLPTGTALDTLFTGVPAVNIGFDFSLINTASGTITVAVGASGMTSVGALTVATGVSARFRLRRTAANTYILYRI
jgi:hypothetical protein